MNNEMQSIQNEQLSKNLVNAREASGKSIKEICSLLSIPTSRLRNYEKGKYIPSLPELESLSYIYRIPLNALTGAWKMDDFIHAPDTDQLQHLIEIRQGIISTRLLIAREKLDISYKNLSQITGVSTARIKRYEKGDSPPLDELIKICEALEIDLFELIDQDSPLGLWQQKQNLHKEIEEISGEMIAFFIDPKNLTHLKFAQEVSKIGLEPLNKLSTALSEVLKVMPFENIDPENS